MRNRIVEAILKVASERTNFQNQETLRESLKYIVSDLSLIAFAQEIGVDTDAVLSEQVPS